MAIINKIEQKDHLPENHINSIMIGIKEQPYVMHNWKILMKEQKQLKKEYAGKLAHPDPDYRKEFNQPDADWKDC